MPGPAPNPNARRRNVKPTTTRLPAGGYEGDVPPWPLSRANKAEKDTWAALWRLPQAAEWIKGAHARTVARYVRALVVAEQREASAFHLSEVRQLEDRLGLTPMAMMRLRWEVVVDETEAPEVADDAPVADVRRLFAV
jgi:hypothetical protein